MCAAVAPLLFASMATAQPGMQDFIRISTDPQGNPVALEVAIAGFERADGARVDLVGAVHVGEREYYQALNRRFAAYQRVLFELVGDPEDSSPAPVSPLLAVVGMFQGGMKKALGLTFQLEEIDYSLPTFVHADLTPREFRQAMDQRDESLGAMLVRAWALGTVQGAGAAGARANADMLKVLLSSDRQLAFRRMLAGQLVEQDQMLQLLSGPEGSTLIEGRNQRALEVMERELAAGHDHLAIFYGAGHLPDFARRLEQDYDFRHTTTEWLPAWDLQGR